MPLTFLGALLLATAAADVVENPRFVSPNGEMVVVMRRFPFIGDFDGISTEAYLRHLEADGAFLEPLPGHSPAQPEPTRGALYRIWPSGHQERLAEFTCGPDERCERVLVADDGRFVTHDAVRCDSDASLSTLRDANGSVVRTVRVRDVMTANDQRWLCGGAEDDVRFTLGDTLRITMLVTDGRWGDGDARHHAVDVDLGSGAVAAPERDRCPAAQRVVAEANDLLPRWRSDADVDVLESQALLDRALVRVLPEYPLPAMKARVSGTVGVQVVVGRDGKVERAWIVKPLPFGLDEAVRAAMAQWEFAPAPSRVSGVLAFRFELVRGPRR